VISFAIQIILHKVHIVYVTNGSVKTPTNIMRNTIIIKVFWNQFIMFTMLTVDNTLGTSLAVLNDCDTYNCSCDFTNHGVITPADIKSNTIVVVVFGID